MSPNAFRCLVSSSLALSLLGCGASDDGTPTATPNGWRLNDPSTIELIGQTCTEFLVGVDSSLDAQFPCDVFIPL
jgi:hypothetical protein